MMELVKKEANPNAGRLVYIYGPTGIGKTTTFCRTPKSVLVECGDNSSQALKASGSLPANYPVITASDLYHSLDIFKGLRDGVGQHGFGNVIVDGGSGLKKWVDQGTLADECNGNKGKFAGFNFGERCGAFPWMELVQVFDEMRSAGLWVFVICHKGIQNEKNPQGADYPKSVPDLGKERLPLSIKDADAVLFMDFLISNVNVDEKTNKGKAVGGDTRVMYTQPAAAYEAKNRLNLDSIIHLGNSPTEAFEAFFKAVKEGKKKAA